MKNKIVIIFQFGLMLLFLFTNASAGYDFPPTFEYRFPLVKTNKIYSGPVIFEHKNHFVDYKIGCVRCHHDVEPGQMKIEKNCRCCHGRQGFPRFEEAAKIGEDETKKYYLVTLHSLCVDCHIEIKRKDSRARPPISCTSCHLILETP